ncbi:LysR family transcriptional regulator [Jiangella muralis]|uniref:LysR family transcriptional regulator n=1 Tax=Jiangella muralis TaxID=702383 RepID=UPI00069E5FE1|nr:LysR family transcriptional regulator [Jiangella muralis]
MSAVLDIVPLRSLVAVAECGGFHRAAAALHITQSAVSQHVRKLEKVLDRPLVVRDGRRGRFTAAGEALLAEARRILTAHDEALRRLGVESSDGVLVVGSSEHAADQLLPEIATALRAAFPRRQVRFRLDRSGRLAQAVDNGSVDVAVVLSSDRSAGAASAAGAAFAAGGASAAGGAFAGRLPLRWFAAPGFRLPPPGEPLPLVVFDEPCALRRRAVEALGAAGREPVIACEAAYLAGILAAARAGLGVAVLAGGGGRPEGLAPLSGLPPIEPAALRVRVRAGAPPSLAAVAAAAVEQVVAGH